MATYLILNCVVLSLVVLALALRGALRWNRMMSVTLVGLLLATALFDSLMIYAGIFAYNPEKILGVSVGLAPIEDFFYAVLAGLIVPNVWHLMHRGSDE